MKHPRRNRKNWVLMEVHTAAVQHTTTKATQIPQTIRQRNGLEIITTIITNTAPTITTTSHHTATEILTKHFSSLFYGTCSFL